MAVLTRPGGTSSDLASLPFDASGAIVKQVGIDMPAGALHVEDIDALPRQVAERHVGVERHLYLRTDAFGQVRRDRSRHSLGRAKAGHREGAEIEFQ